MQKILGEHSGWGDGGETSSAETEGKTEQGEADVGAFVGMEFPFDDLAGFLESDLKILLLITSEELQDRERA